MLGGGTWVTQNKVLPGAYINVVKASSGNIALTERGNVAIALPLTTTKAGEVIEITAAEFANTPDDILGTGVPENSLKALREIFKRATKAFIYNTYVAEAGSPPAVTAICAALEPYEFNVLAAYTNTQSDITAYITAVKAWRDDIGKKVQCVVYNSADADYEGVINVVSTVSDDSADTHALVAWVAGAEAGCEINETCTNMKYDGEYTIVVDKTQSQLEGCIRDGQFVFHLVYGDIRVLEDINSLTTTSADKGEDFKSNQTIRVIDQIANDIAYLFNKKYLGVIPNDASGRASFWGDIVKHHRELQTLRAIENFDSSLVTVEQGETKKSIVVTDAISVVNAMSQLYMTVVVS